MTESNNTSQRNNLEETHDYLLKIFKVPSLKPKLQPTNVEIFNCNLIVDLNELFSRSDIKPKTRIFRIYGNIIQLSSDLTIPPLNGGGVILIAARRIEIKQGCKITVNYKKSFRIVIYAREMTSELEIIAINQLKNESNLLKFDSNISKDNKTVGKSLTIRDDKNPENKDLYIFDSFILENNSFLKMVRYSLLIASVLFYDEPEITRSILSWICKITESQSCELHHQALSIFVQLDISEERRKNEISFIPLLDKEFYKKGIDEFMKSVEYYENKYMQFLTKRHAITQEKTESKVSLENSNDETTLNVHLEKIEHERYDSASKLMKKIEDELKNKKNDVSNACKSFKDGIEEWKQQKIHEAEKEMLIAVFSLAVRVGTIVIRPDGIVDIIKTIEKTSFSIQDALNAADKVKEFVEKNKDIKDKLQKIKQIDEDLKSNYNMADDLNNNMMTEQERIESLDVNELAQVLKTEDRKGTKMKVEWKSTRNGVMKLLNYPIDQGIKGANEYKDSLEDLFNYINAYIVANNDEAKSYKEYSRIKLQVEMFKRKEERLKKMIEDYELKEDYYVECAFLLFECYINIKCWMLTYLENYRCAYKYWSLSESDVELSVKKTIDKLIKDKKIIYKELESTYYKFGGPPQISAHSICLPVNYIKKFMNNRFIIYEIPLDHPEFRRCERVRLINFRVFLKGIGSKDDEISFFINNTNTYNDRYGGKSYHFISGYRKGQEFRYKVPSKILTDISFRSDIYFVPTPFSRWTIKLDECKIGDSKLVPSEVDLSELKSIEINLDVECYFIEK
ncbi:31986_t:CDS:2 [Gigaspora margarita]|uniref:31986_t:CDS:1 n=1 Tax=Gigaspora margarita TaxID=4874 RepID=A0ABN7UMN3_GIGMA|nr:31986_t:CDS:2 [Gigaspora margarita]